MIELENHYSASNYSPLPVVFVRAEGVYVWDENGKQYLDMMSAYSAASHGHCHPKIIETVIQQAQKLNVISRAFYTDKLGAFLKYACELTGQEKAIPMNSGSEGVEVAIKTARKWAYKTKGIPKDKAEIIVCEGNFHGRTTTIISFSSEPQYREDFGPLTPGFKIIPYGDANALEAAITPNTAAFLVEPFQGEAGIRVPPVGYLRKCAEICRENNVLLIADEVQTGLGRTGKLLGCEHEGVKPDGIILGKALGGGVLPVSLFLSTAEILNLFKPGDHGSTFGGNPLASAVGLRALQVIVEEGLVEKSAELGSYFLRELSSINSILIKEVRGQGLFIGLEVDTGRISARDLCLAMLKNGILTKDTHGTVLRFCPPLVITKEQIDEGLEVIRQTLAVAEQSISVGTGV